MKFTIAAGVFLDGLKSVQARAKSNSIELLKHLRFDLEGTKLTLLGHDTSASSQAYLEVEGTADGTCAVPADAIVKLMGSLPKEVHVVIERQEYQITIKAGRSRYKLPVLASDDFPDALPCAEPVEVALTAEDVQQLFARPRGALNPSEAIAALKGCYLHAVDGVLCSVGTDQVHFARLSSKARLPALVGIVVPYEAMEEIERLGSAGGALSVGRNTVAFATANGRFCSLLVDAQFPADYMRIVPPTGRYVEVDRAELQVVARRLSLLAMKESEIHLRFSESEIIASIEGAGSGVETVASSGGPLPGMLALSPKRLVEMLDLPKGEVIQLHFDGTKIAMRVVDPFEPDALFAEAGRIPKSTRQEAA